MIEVNGRVDGTDSKNHHLSSDLGKPRYRSAGVSLPVSQDLLAGGWQPSGAQAGSAVGSLAPGLGVGRHGFHPRSTTQEEAGLRGVSIGTRGGHPVELCRSDGLRNPYIARFLIDSGILWMSLSLSFCRLDVVPRGTPTRRFPTLPSSLVRPRIDDSAAMDTLGSCSSIPNGTMSS